MFPVYYEDRLCGKANMERQGLYYRIICKCKIPTVAPCKIQIRTDGRNINLGTCIKSGDLFTIDTKIPCKYIQETSIKFYILPKEPEGTLGFVPIGEDVPFPHLHKLDKARMRYCSKQVGVIFME